MVTSIELESAKHPSKSARLLPTVAPESPSSKLTNQIRHTPAPEDSKSKTLNVSTDRILKAVSVISQTVLGPLLVPITSAVTNSIASSSTHIDTTVVSLEAWIEEKVDVHEVVLASH